MAATMEKARRTTNVAFLDPRDTVIEDPGVLQAGNEQALIHSLTRAKNYLPTYLLFLQPSTSVNTSGRRGSS